MEPITFPYQPLPGFMAVDYCPLGDAGITCWVCGKAAEIRKVAA